ncbi:MAG: class I SAM-dependent methyltransferase, partial [Pseudomonadota bacterium]|nr:class I SAM-dependent methyltransferase [Pseudomonadota bacterium]
MTQPLSVDTTLADEIGAPGFWERVFERWCQNIDRGVLTVRFPSGRRITFRGPNPGPEAAIRLHHPRVIRRLFFGGDIGLAEGYMADEWDCRDLTKVLAFGAANLQAMDRVLAAAWPRRLLNRLYHSRRANTRRGSRRNIAAHYDLGNTFYRHWLDETMTYSAALFAHPDEDLAVAQERKYRRLAEAINLSAADHVLEVGCGWGGFATFAARTYGCRVTGLTLSKEQAAHAT